MQTDLRRIHGAATHRERDHPKRRMQPLGQRGDPAHHLHRFGCPRVATGDAGQGAAPRPAVAAGCDGHRHRRGVQQAVGGGAHHHLAQLAVGRGSEHQQVGVEFGDHFGQASGHRTVRVAVKDHLVDFGPVGFCHGLQFARGLLGRVGRQLVGPGGVLGVHPRRRRERPRPRHDGRHRQRGAQGAGGTGGQMQWRSATLAGQVADDDGHGTSFGGWMTSTPVRSAVVTLPGFSALWCLLHRK